jgi:hypothetical protein
MTPRDTSQRQLHLVRYEDLMDDAGAILAGLNENLGWGLSDAAIAEAVKRSTRDEMRTQEGLYRRHNPAHRLDFVGKAKADLVSPQADRIARECAEELTYLGYAES